MGQDPLEEMGCGDHMQDSDDEGMPGAGQMMINMGERGGQTLFPGALSLHIHSVANNAPYYLYKKGSICRRSSVLNRGVRLRRGVVRYSFTKRGGSLFVYEDGGFVN